MQAKCLYSLAVTSDLTPMGDAAPHPGTNCSGVLQRARGIGSRSFLGSRDQNGNRPGLLQGLEGYFFSLAGFSAWFDALSPVRSAARSAGSGDWKLVVS